ncbi:MAG TPA: hypothetical protein VEC94_13310 [Pseudolabrys sp.]|nr:hypothetical protein [Pseudolabrys sp.]
MSDPAAVTGCNHCVHDVGLQVFGLRISHGLRLLVLTLGPGLTMISAKNEKKRVEGKLA